MLKGKTAVITGGTRGIGAAIAQQYASMGVNLALIYAGNRQAAVEPAATTEKQRPFWYHLSEGALSAPEKHKKEGISNDEKDSQSTGSDAQGTGFLSGGSGGQQNAGAEQCAQRDALLV